MTNTLRPAVGEQTLASIRAGEPPPIDQAWKDEFVESLLRELRRQLHQLENSPPLPHADDAGLRAQNTQTLARIERTLERLLKNQEQRVLKRDKKVAAEDENARTALERRLDKLLAAGTAELAARKDKP